MKILDQLKSPIVPSEVEEMAKIEGQQSSETEKGEMTKPVKIELNDSDVYDETSSVLSEPDEDVKVKLQDMEEPPRKKQMTVEEYEAMLDAEDGEGGFLEAGDIAGNSVN